MKNIEYIKLDDCIDRHLYQIHSRNLKFAVFRKESKGFIGLREKLGCTYMFEEYHCDTNHPFGTVKPLKDLNIILPDNIILVESFPGNVCGNCNVDVEYKKVDEPFVKYGITYNSKWMHIADTKCGNITPYSKYNYDLDKWLREQEKIYANSLSLCDH